MSYATMSKRALKSVREATAFELDELAERYEIVATHLRERLEEIDEILTRRIKYDNKNRESTERFHARSNVPNTEPRDDSGANNSDGLQHEGGTREEAGRDLVEKED